MLNIVTEFLEGDWKLDILKAFFSKPSCTTRVKILELLRINKQYQDETVSIF